MYDMYPDWGPASHHPENPRSRRRPAAVQAALDLRDNGGQRARRQLTSPHDHRPDRRHLDTGTLAVIPGDGIGPEVTAEALKVLEAVAVAGEVRADPLRPRRGALPRAPARCCPTPCSTRSASTTRSCSGAVGGKPNDPNLPPGILERGLLLKLRFELDHYVNLRPSRLFPGATRRPLADPGEVDFVVVREGTEGPYTGNGGALRVGTPAEVATEVSVNTAYGVERVVRDAFARGPAAPAQEAHPGPQDQRAGPRRLAVVAPLRAGRPPSSPTSRPTTCTSTPR